MRIVFMGTPTPAATILEFILASSSHEVVGVITQPDRPKGRGLKLSFSPVKEVAVKNNLLVEQPEKIKDGKIVRWLERLQPDIIIVVAYGKILPKEILEIPKFGCINIHASLLPKYRGAAPVQWALLNGEKETGLSIMKIDEGLDTGAILLQQKIAIAEDDNAETLLHKLFAGGGVLLKEALNLLESKQADFIPQKDSVATFAPSLTKESGEIDWRKSASELHNRVRALIPWPAAHTYYNKKQLKLLVTQIAGPVLEKKGQPGEIIQVVKGIGFLVSCGDGNLLIVKVQPEGGKIMSAFDFAIGRQLKPGIVFPS